MKQADSENNSGLSRRSFLATGLAAGLLAERAGAAAPEAASEVPAPGPPKAFELAEATIADLQAGLESGRYTARGLVEAYLGRIRELDGRLSAVLETNPQALEIADALDRERKEKGARGPLHGIPLLLKDNIATADRMTTTAGSLALEGSIPRRDAFAAERLRAAGAILLGKTNMSEWANFRSTHSSSGWSSRGGQCRNPYALDRSPSGSSSGTGAAIAASFAAAGLGSETDGSIVSPASVSSLVGIKPTVGLVSRSGVIPIAHSQDTLGPMTRTVADAAILLGALTGVDPRDPATAESRGKAESDYRRFLDPKGLAGARIGVARKGHFGYSPGTDAVIEQAIAALRRLGAVVVDPADLATTGYDDETTVLLYEFKADLNLYLAELGPDAPVHSLKEVIELNERHRDRVMPYFGQELLLQAEEKGPLTSPEYRKALAANHRLARKEGIDATLAQHKLDALIAPTGGPAWLIDLVNGDSYGGGSTSPAAVSGYPAITVPAGFFRGLPIGLTFFGPAWSEGKLLRYAYAFEQETNARRAPELRSNAEL